MSIQSGAISGRMFMVRGILPDNIVDKLADDAFPGLDNLGKSRVAGWVSNRHMLDSNITKDSAYLAGYLCVSLVVAERKIPEKLLAAECQMEILAEMAARNVAYLKRAERTEIRKAVIDRMLSTAPVAIKETPLVVLPNVSGYVNSLAFAEVTSDAQSDALCIQFKMTTGCDLIPLDATAMTVLLKEKAVIGDLVPANFNQQTPDGSSCDIGSEFFTWFWYWTEETAVGIAYEDSVIAGMIEGPIKLVGEGEGAHCTLLTGGSPTACQEATDALLSGKLLAQSKMHLLYGDIVYTCTFDASSFTITSLQLPKSESIDTIGKFQERMLALSDFICYLTKIYYTFLNIRLNDWADTELAVYNWINLRMSSK